MSEPTNQCEGCQAGWLVVERYHRVTGAGGYAGEIAACTRDRYATDWRARAERAEAEVKRLRKLFDDAGQGEHNVLALVDHYQREAIEAVDRAERAEADLADALKVVRVESIGDGGRREACFVPVADALAAERARFAEEVAAWHYALEDVDIDGVDGCQNHAAPVVLCYRCELVTKVRAAVAKLEGMP